MMARMVRLCGMWVILFVVFGAERAAEAAEIECGLAETGLIVVDGMLDDWQGVQPVQQAGAAASDASFKVYCNYDAGALYLAIDVRDERLIRRDKRDRSAEDHLVIAFGDRRLEVFPADAASHKPRKARWSDGKAPKGLVIADSLQKQGWSVEVGVPFDKLPGWSRGVPSLPFTLEFRDADMLTENGVQEIVTIGAGRLDFAEAKEMYEQFLRDHRVKPQDIVIDELVDMDGEPGPERVLVAGRTVGVIGADYVFLKLPARRRGDLLSIRVVDLAGEGKHCVLAHYVELGNGGEREVVAVWNLLPDGSFARTWAHEVAKRMGEKRITNTWALAPRQVVKGKRKRTVPGFDIVVRAGEAVGWTAETWNEEPAEDLAPILLPWGPKKQAVWHFRGNESYGGE